MDKLKMYCILNMVIFMDMLTRTRRSIVYTWNDALEFKKEIAWLNCVPLEYQHPEFLEIFSTGYSMVSGYQIKRYQL